MPYVAKVRKPKDMSLAGANARARAIRRQGTRGYAVSQRIRKRIEEIFGWAKTTGGLSRTRFKGRWRLVLQCLVVGAAYNLVRMAKMAE